MFARLVFIIWKMISQREMAIYVFICKQCWIILTVASNNVIYEEWKSLCHFYRLIEDFGEFNDFSCVSPIFLYDFVLCAWMKWRNVCKLCNTSYIFEYQTLHWSLSMSCVHILVSVLFNKLLFNRFVLEQSDRIHFSLSNKNDTNQTTIIYSIFHYSIGSSALSLNQR